MYLKNVYHVMVILNWILFGSIDPFQDMREQAYIIFYKSCYSMFPTLKCRQFTTM